LIQETDFFRWSPAESEATKALDVDPKDITAVYRRAMARGEQGNYAGARED
jgi:cytochrome c-type biogenesis protein CcmH/NrfG